MAHPSLPRPPQDSERSRASDNVVPSPEELNRQLARSREEFELFQRLDAELPWPGVLSPLEVPPWLRFSEADLAAAQAMFQKKQAKVGLCGLTVTMLMTLVTMLLTLDQEKQAKVSAEPKGCKAKLQIKTHSNS